jgi:hypothetical protein
VSEEWSSERSEKLDFEGADRAELEQERSAEHPPIETLRPGFVRVSAFGSELSERGGTAREHSDRVVADSHRAEIEIEDVQIEISGAAGLLVLLAEEVHERKPQRR